MNKFNRLILLCLLMLAIPLQGLAAASMMLCATEHHQNVNAQSTQGAQGNEHTHDSHVQSHDADDHSSDAVTTHQHTSKDKCSNCSACCVGAVMLTSTFSSPISPPASEKIEMVFSSHIGHISDSLERPPRA